MKDVLNDITFDLNEIASIDEAVKLAISLEDQGRDFYLENAGSTKNPGAHEMYQYLADEEKKHTEYLEKFLKDGDTTVEMTGSPDFRGSFSVEFAGDRLEEVGVMLAALRFERKSEYFYQELAKRATDTRQREFFENIADFERGHYEIIDSMLEYATQFRMQT
ncbi:MAG: ferritin family protein [Euryarchaeota archaeon]|nr:ferritin family protein [Euryarchaeota archaeon]